MQLKPTEKVFPLRYHWFIIPIASNIEQVLGVAANKAAAVRPPNTHHENYQNYTNQTCGTLLEK